MKKVLSLLVAFVIALSFGNHHKSAVASPVDTWIDLDAKVSSEVFSVLQKRAGFSAYLYTDTKLEMNPENLSNLVIEEIKEDYFIASYESYSTKILVTTDGLFVAFTPKEVAHTIYPDDLHLQNIQSAVKVLTGYLITEVHYFNFANMGSNKALSYFDESTENSIFDIPKNSVINAISYANTVGQAYSRLNYGSINLASLEPGKTHPVNNFGRNIDDIRVFNQPSTVMNVFYTSDDLIQVEGSEQVKDYDLVDKFKIDISGVPTIELLKINISDTSIMMKPGKLHTVLLTGLYSDGSEKIIDPAVVIWTSSKPAVAGVENGQIEALNPGKTRLNIEYEGKMVLINVEVQDYRTLDAKPNQPVNKPWNVKFNANVQEDSILPSNIYVTDSAGKTIPTSLIGLGKVVRIIPIVNYKPGETYTVWVKDVKSSTGKTINQYTKMDFTIEK